MTSLVAAAALFLGIHVFVSATPLRAALVDRIGLGPYQGLFSLASLGALVWLALAYGEAPVVGLWDFGAGGRHLALAVMPFAFVLAVCGLTTRNPTAAGMEAALQADDAARGILKVTRHPFLWGVVLWSLAHLAANGDAASLVLFGTMLVLALIGPPLIDARRARAAGGDWERYRAATSNLPLAAIVAGRARTSLGEIGWWRILLGLALYLAVLFLHEWLFGVTPLPL